MQRWKFLGLLFDFRALLRQYYSYVTQNSLLLLDQGSRDPDFSGRMSFVTQHKIGLEHFFSENTYLNCLRIKKIEFKIHN